MECSKSIDFFSLRNTFIPLSVRALLSLSVVIHRAKNNSWISTALVQMIPAASSSCCQLVFLMMWFHDFSSVPVLVVGRYLMSYLSVCLWGGPADCYSQKRQGVGGLYLTYLGDYDLKVTLAHSAGSHWTHTRSLMSLANFKLFIFTCSKS